MTRPLLVLLLALIVGAAAAPEARTAELDAGETVFGVSKGPARKLVGKLLDLERLLCRLRLLRDCRPEPPVPPADPQHEALERLQKASATPVEIGFEKGLPHFVAMDVQDGSTASDDPIRRAFDFLEEFAPLYHLELPRAELYAARVVSTSVNTAVHFGFQRDGIPLHGVEMTVFVMPGRVIGTSGAYPAVLPPPKPPTIDAAAAVQALLAHVLLVEARIDGDPRLVYYDPQLRTRRAFDPRVVWRVGVHGIDESEVRRSITGLVDAETGAVLTTENRELAFGPPEKDFDIDSAGGVEVGTCDFDDEEDWFDENGEDGYDAAHDPLGDGFRGFDNLHLGYDYYFDLEHLHGFDGDDGAIVLMLRSGSGAWFLPECDWILVGDGWSHTDTIVHEYLHGIISHWYGWPVLRATVEESYADVFGAMTSGSWFPASHAPPSSYGREECPNAPDGRVRNMADPNQCGDAEHLDDPLGVTDPRRGQHLLNKAAYQLTEGGEHRGVQVRGIGRAKVERLAVNTLLGRMNASSREDDVRDQSVDVARWLVRTDRFGFTTADVCSVINAFASVGLGPQDRDCDGRDDVEDPDNDGDGSADEADNCSDTFNPGQQDVDQDGDGDACDPDVDGDELANGDDNCPETMNRGQEDRDFDGRGDHCDDNDGDGFVDAIDKCPDVDDPGQENSDSDARGDACDEDDDDDGIPDDGDGSGIAGDRPCEPGNTLECDDSCRTVANLDQADGDQDGVGNVCDHCPLDADPTNLDTDGDEVGDVCDTDDDNDFVLDESDNCRVDANPDQFDLDRRGGGLACDENEAFMLSGEAREPIVGSIRFGKLGDKVRLPIRPCIADGCTDFFAPGYRTSIEAVIPQARSLRIVSDTGGSVASAREGSGALDFKPSAGTYVRSLDGRPSAAAPQYYLEVLPAVEAVGREVSVEIGVRSEVTAP